MEEGSAADDLGGLPDSWEMADLDESLSRLLVSPPRISVRSPSPPPPMMPASATSSSSAPRSESTIQVDQFLREALEKPRERLSILRMEQDVEKFIRDPTQQELEFQSLPTSYLRLAAHRVAEHYCLQSTAIPDSSSLDGSGSRIVLRKTSQRRPPLVRLADIPVNLQPDDNNTVVKVAIKQRPHKRSQTISNTSNGSSKNNHQKSVEERKEEYNRARARIFSSISSGGSVAKPEVVPTPPDEFQRLSLVPTKQEERTINEMPEMGIRRGLVDSSGSIRSYSTRTENEPVVSRYRASNRVAIFRDHEVDRKDPDYDRNYERYVQRFDPGYVFSGGPYAMQPMYTPAVNYNTEFPQLGPGHRPHIFVEHLPRNIPQNLRAPWSPASGPTAIGYGPPESMMTPFSPNHVGPQASSSIYMHSSQYPVPPRLGMSSVHPHEHVQSFPQAYCQQPESSFGLAQPH